MQKATFLSIEGCRTLLSFWVVACHVCGLIQFFTYLQAPENPQQIYELFYSLWSPPARGFGYQVDLFFMFSGFLLSFSLFKTFQQESYQLKFQHQSPLGSKLLWIFKETLFYACKRILRLWPAMIFTILFTIILGDYRSTNYSLLFSLLFFPNGIDVPSAFIVQWSNQVDFICSIILFIVLYCCQYFSPFSLKNLTFAKVSFLAFVSFIPKVYRFLTFIPTLSYLQIKASGNLDESLIPPTMNYGRHQYFDQTLYPNTFLSRKYPSAQPLMTNLMNNEYLVYHQRITPFFIGFILALVIFQQYFPANESSKSSNSRNKDIPLSWLTLLLHKIYLFCSLLILFQPILIGIISYSQGVKKPFSMENYDKLSQPQPNPKFIFDFFFSVLNRPLFAISLAYIIYRCLLPSKHVLYLSRLNSFLSQSWLIQYSKYSYALYVIHMKVIMEVMWRLLPFDYLKLVFLPLKISLFWYFLIYLILSYGISLFLAMFIHHYIEYPLQKHLIPSLLSHVRWTLDYIFLKFGIPKFHSKSN